MDSPRAYEMNAKLFRLYIAGVLTLSTIAIVIWFVIMVRASYVPPPRAVSHLEHQSCLDIPRGNQAMEDNRLACFNELYDSGRVVMP